LTQRLGRLPGDIVLEDARRGITCFVPIVSSILVSLILTIVLNIVIRLLRK
jgi:hypothetical protein